MSKEEAARFMLLVSTMIQGGEVFVLKTGEAVPILDLARRLVVRAGKTIRMPGDSEGDIEIKFTELKSGEKLREELFGTCAVSRTEHPEIVRIDEIAPEIQKIESLLVDLDIACSKWRTDSAIEILDEMVSGSRQAPKPQIPMADK